MLMQKTSHRAMNFTYVNHISPWCKVSHLMLKQHLSAIHCFIFAGLRLCCAARGGLALHGGPTEGHERCGETLAAECSLWTRALSVRARAHGDAAGGATHLLNLFTQHDSNLINRNVVKTVIPTKTQQRENVQSYRFGSPARKDDGLWISA